jgi:phosphatidylglycerophosphate synthase
MAAGLCFAATWWFPPGARAFWLLGAALVQARLLANLFDGMVAVGLDISSPLGELYNEVPDRVSDTAILLGLGMAAGGNWGLRLAAALAAMATAYIRAVGKAAGAPSDFSGPMAKQQPMALATAAGIWCSLVPHRGDGPLPARHQRAAGRRHRAGGACYLEGAFASWPPLAGCPGPASCA